MKPLFYRKSENKLLFIHESRVYLADGSGRVKRSFSLNDTLNLSGYSRCEPVLDVAAAIAGYECAKKADYESTMNHLKKVAIDERAKRRENILNLRLWRAGKVDAFVIETGICYNNNKNYSNENIKHELVFGIDAANALFDELKESDEPIENEQYFYTEIRSFSDKYSISRIEITSIDELENQILQHGDAIENSYYAKNIEDCEYVITDNGRYGRQVEHRRASGYWLGDTYWCAQQSTADLGSNQFAVTRDELIEYYPLLAEEAGLIESNE